MLTTATTLSRAADDAPPAPAADGAGPSPEGGADRSRHVGRSTWRGSRLGRWWLAAARGLGRFAIAVAFPATALALWQVASDREWIAAQILPAPAVVWATLIDLAQTGDIHTNLFISLERVAWGFGVGALVGLILGVAMGLSRGVEAYLYPTFNVISQIPALGWIPLLMMFLGIGDALKIVIIAKAASVPVAINAFKGIRNIPADYIEVATAYRFSRAQLLRSVIIPASLPSLFTGLRGGLMHAWLALVTVELLASSEGIGFLMVWGRQLFQLDVVIAAMLVIGLVGLVLDQILQRTERRLLRWRTTAF